MKAFLPGYKSPLTFPLAPVAFQAVAHLAL